MKVKTYVDLKTNIITENSYPEDENSNDKLIEYLEDEVYKAAKDTEVKGTMEVKEFGKVSYMVDLYEFVNDDYKGSVRVTFEYNDSIAPNEDFVGEALSNALQKDNFAYNRLREEINNLINAVNECIKHICIPKKEFYMFYDHYFYIQFSAGSNYAHSVEWMPFAYSDDFDYESMIEDIYE